MKFMIVDGIGNMMKLELMLGVYLYIYECLNVDVLYKYMYVCVQFMNECLLKLFVKFIYICILRLYLLYFFNVSVLMFFCYLFFS